MNLIVIRHLELFKKILRTQNLRIFFFSIIFIFFCFLNCKIFQEEKRFYAIIKASNLICRKEGSFNSIKINSFKFGSIVTLKINDYKEIEKKEWIEVEKENCFIHREYIIVNQEKTNEIFKLDPESFKCLDTEFEEEYPIYVIGNIFLHVKKEMIDASPSPEKVLYKIGILKSQENEFILNYLMTGIFNPIGEWKKKIIKNQNQILYRKKDKEYD